MLSRFYLIPERYGWTERRTDRRTDGQTDRFAISISRVSMLTRDKNYCFITMCKAHSKVTHIKQQKYFHHLKRPDYNQLEVMKIFLLFYMCHFAMGLTHIVIKQ